MFKNLREPINGLTHYVAAIAAVIGLGILAFASRADFIKQMSFTVYGASLTALLMASASYHLITAEPSRILFLRKIDHSAIYFLIAGTYTPICMLVMKGFWQWGMLSIIWAIALIGVTVKIFLIKAPRWLTVGIYLAMGWFGVLAIGDLVQALPMGAIVFLALGGVFFTLGGIVYATKMLDFKPGVFGFHEIWHLFVIAGCLSHYLLMAFYVMGYQQT
jgi:hemolysin III